MKTTGSLCFAAAALLVLSVPVQAQLPPVPSAPLRQAYYAASEGRALESLQQYRQVLAAARDTTLIAEIAVQTGELYQVTELSTDGRELVASSDGALLGFRAQVGAAPDSQALHVYRVGRAGQAPQRVAEVIGSRLALWNGPAGFRVAYLTPGDAVAIEGARIQMDRARQSQSSLEFLAARQQLAWLSVSTAQLRLRNGAGGDEVVVDLEGRTPIDWQFSSDGSLIVAASLPGVAGSGLFRVDASGAWERLDGLEGYKSNLRIAAGGDQAVINVPAEDPAPQEPGQRRAGANDASGRSLGEPSNRAGKPVRGE